MAIILGCSLTGSERSLATEQGDSLVLFTFGGNFDIGSVVTSDAKVTRAAAGLRIETGHKKPWPGITLKAPSGKWDLSKYEYISIRCSIYQRICALRTSNSNLSAVLLKLSQ